MNYLDYIKNKLGVKEDKEIVEAAILLIGGMSPEFDSNKKGYEIVDNWIENIILKWNIQINTLNISGGSFLGKIEPRAGGFTINLNRNLYTTQKRYTIAHEIAHVLSYDIKTSWPTYLLTHSKIEEDFCDKISRGLLLPEKLIPFGSFNLKHFDELMVQEIKNLWPEFKVAPWRIINRLFDLTTPNDLIAILWEFHPDEDCFKIIDHSKPKNIFIPKHDRAFIDTIFKKKATNYAPEAAFKNDYYRGLDTVEIGSLYKKELFVTAFSINTSHSKYIIELIEIEMKNH